MNRILIIDDDVDTCMLLSSYLQSKGYEVETAFSGNKGLQKVRTEHFDVVLCDYRLGDKEGLDVLREIKQINRESKVVIITAYSDIHTAVKVIKEGAYDYITKPMIPEEVLNIVKSICEESALDHDLAHSNDKDSSSANRNSSGELSAPPEEYVRGDDPVMLNVYKEIDLVSPTNYSVVLYGESGTGKEVIAKTIHSRSRRANHPFIALDCGTLSKDLAGSELFGHVKGAFTGAISDKPGHFEMANGGTLFLDEVANLSYDIQAALLRVIQERQFKRIGGVKEMKLDIRIIVATNEDLKAACCRGKFREDLFHRLNEFFIVLPPLRERSGDIPGFAYHFLNKVNRELDKHVTGISEEAMDALTHYKWPGNIRELRNVMRRAVLLTKGEELLKEHLPESVLMSDLSEDVPVESSDEAPNMASGLKEASGQAEYAAVMNVLRRVNYNKTKAALILNIDRKTLYNKLKKYREELFKEE